MHTIPLPSSLTSRDGWADLLAIRRPSEPHVHQIEPTNHCPYTCIMCPRANKMTRPLGFMEMELYQKIIAEIDGYAEPVRSKEIELFHFGESLLHPRIHEMVGYASGKGLKTVLSVNAPQLTPKIAEAILENRPHRLIISLDGYDEQSYRQIRGKAADFSKAVDNIKNLISLKRESNSDTQTCIRMIRLELNSGHLDRFVEEWQDNGISVELRPFFPWTERELVPLGDVQKYPPGMPCPFPWQYLVVQWDGTVVPCCRDYNAVNAIGNARTDSLRNIWNGPGYELFRQQHRGGDYGTNTFCSDCMDIFYTEPEGDVCETKFESPHTIRHLWQEAVNNFSTRPLICSDDDGSVFNYEDAGTIVSILAQRLRSKGIGKGDRICVCSPIHPEALFAFWASAMLGAVFVPLDYALPKTTLQAIIEEVEPAIIFCDSIRGDLLTGISDCQIVVFDGDDDSPYASSCRFSDWMGEGSDSFLPAVVCEDDPAVILYTSGTSGLPKGVVLSHGALYRSGRLMSTSYGWRKDDIFLGLAELHTMSGLRNPAVAAIHCGCAVVVAAPPVRTNALAVVGCIGRHRASIMSTVPALIRHLNHLTGKIGKDDLKPLRMVLCTGSLLPAPVRDSFLDYYGVPLFNYYGLTETSGLCIGVLPGLEIGHDSIGVPLECIAAIVDDHGSPLGYNEVGELIISSNNLMTEYYRKPGLTGAVIRDGSFNTGDLAFKRPDGSIILVDRKGDAFKDRRGELVHPSEIEQVLEAHPQVAEAGVCAYRVRRDEEQCAAFIVLKGCHKDEETLVFELRRYLLDKLGSYKVPSLFHFVQDLPRGTNGKLLRKKLMESTSNDK